MKTKDLTLCALFVVLYTLASKLVIPTGLIPLTLQTMAMILAGMLLSYKMIFLSYGMYLILGLLGLPLFANGGGIAYVLQPSFGFLLSFPFAASFLAFMRLHFKCHSFFQILPFGICAILIVYTLGCLYMMGVLNFYLGMSKNFMEVLAIGATPFILSDSISTALGCICGLRLQQVPLIQRTQNF